MTSKGVRRFMPHVVRRAKAAPRLAFHPVMLAKASIQLLLALTTLRSDEKLGSGSSAE
jgi:hypothetical protein